jgi:hypothetical protein
VLAIIRKLPMPDYARLLEQSRAAVPQFAAAAREAFRPT